LGPASLRAYPSQSRGGELASDHIPETIFERSKMSVKSCIYTESDVMQRHEHGGETRITPSGRSCNRGRSNAFRIGYRNSEYGGDGREKTEREQHSNLLFSPCGSFRYLSKRFCSPTPSTCQFLRKNQAAGQA
jgi:hypothetical protein